MKRGIVCLSIILSLLLVSSVAALEFDIDITPSQKTILDGEIAEFEITISHNYERTLEYSVYSPNIAWDVYTNPIPMKIPANGEATGKLFLKPTYATPGYHVIPIHIRPYGIDMFKRVFVEIGLNSIKEVKNYVPALKPTITIDESVNPADTIFYSVKLQNQNTRNLDSVTVKVRSNLINEDYKTTLAPKEIKSIDFETVIDQLTPPQKDTLAVTVIVDADNKTYKFDAEPVHYTISEYGEIGSDVQVIEGFLKTVRVIKLTNTGNDVKKMTYKVEKTFFKSFFMNFEPEFYMLKNKNGKFFALDVSLESQGTMQLTIEENYRLGVILLILLIVGLVAYLMFRSPIIIKKTAIVSGTKEGGITDLKVLLYIKNRSKHTVKHVVVLDKVPNIARLMKKFELGSLKPSKIGKDSGGTLVKWDLHDLESLEERIISYQMSSKLTIIGGMNLPVALVKFKHAKGVRKTRSNISKVGFTIK